MSIVQRKLINGIVFFLLPFFIFMGVVIYANNNVEKLALDENTRTVINIAGVFIAILFLRFFANTIMDWQKASRSWQKKVIKGEITGRKDKTLFIAGQEVYIGNTAVDTFQNGDEVLVEMSVAGNYVLQLLKSSSAVEDTSEKNGH